MKIRAPFKIQTVYAPDGETPAAFVAISWIHMRPHTATKIMRRQGWEDEHERRGFSWTFPAFGYHRPRWHN